jgi:hypothetical protein
MAMEGALALTYDPSCKAWMLDLKPMALHPISPTPTADDLKAPPKGRDKVPRRRGLTRCRELISQRFAKCLVCYRPAGESTRRIRSGDGLGKKPSTGSRQYGYYSQMSMRGRDEKLNEAIVYCKKTMRRESSGCHQTDCIPRRSYMSSSH